MIVSKTSVFRSGDFCELQEYLVSNMWSCGDSGCPGEELKSLREQVGDLEDKNTVVCPPHSRADLFPPHSKC